MRKLTWIDLVIEIAQKWTQHECSLFLQIFLPPGASIEEFNPGQISAREFADKIKVAHRTRPDLRSVLAKYNFLKGRTQYGFTDEVEVHKVLLTMKKVALGELPVRYVSASAQTVAASTKQSHQTGSTQYQMPWDSFRGAVVTCIVLVVLALAIAVLIVGAGLGTAQGAQATPEAPIASSPVAKGAPPATEVISNSATAASTLTLTTVQKQNLRTMIKAVNENSSVSKFTDFGDGRDVMDEVLVDLVLTCNGSFTETLQTLSSGKRGCQ